MEDKKYLSIITRDVITAKEENNVSDIARLIKQHNIGAVVIMRDGKVEGIVSERDIVTRIVAENLPYDTLVKDFMTKNVLAVQLKEGLNKVYQTLCEIDFRHLIILDGEKMIGITSRRDLLDALSAKKKK